MCIKWPFVDASCNQKIYAITNQVIIFQIIVGSSIFFRIMFKKDEIISVIIIISSIYFLFNISKISQIIFSLSLVLDSAIRSVIVVSHSGFILSSNLKSVFCRKHIKLKANVLLFQLLRV